MINLLDAEAEVFLVEPVIETSSLTKTYGSLTAVNKLNLKVERNTIHGFLGPNGAGKSTTIRMLTGLLSPDKGSIKVLGHGVNGDNASARSKMGYMPELPRFPKHLKGYELLDIYGRMCGMGDQERREQIPRLIEMVGLKGRERDLIGRYSKGMQQRIGIAQALLGDPELLILDEPSVGLDPVGMVEVRNLMQAISKEGRTVFLSSHLLFEVEQICTHVTIIHRGVSLVSDTLQNVSKMLQGSAATLQIEVANLSKKVVDAVKKQPFVSGVTENGNIITIQVKTSNDVREQISREITNAGGTIVNMNVRGQSLEEVFIQLVTNHDQQKGGGSQ
jgi:ABC-type multidrug transport system ATPase subunit